MYGKKAVAAIYFTTFAAIAGFVLLQLVVAVILEKFVESATSEGLFANNNFFEVMHRKILLDRFMKQLQTKVCCRPSWPSPPKLWEYTISGHMACPDGLL